MIIPANHSYPLPTVLRLHCPSTKVIGYILYSSVHPHYVPLVNEELQSEPVLNYASLFLKVTEYQNMVKDVNRSAYTKRILEIVANIKKQKNDIDKVRYVCTYKWHFVFSCAPGDTSLFACNVIKQMIFDFPLWENWHTVTYMGVPCTCWSLDITGHSKRSERHQSTFWKAQSYIQSHRRTYF